MRDRRALLWLCSRRARRTTSSGASSGAARATRVFRAPVVDAERARAESDDLQQAASHHHVFDEMEYLVCIGEVRMEEHCRREAEQRQDTRRGTRLQAYDHQGAAADLDHEGPRVG